MCYFCTLLSIRSIKVTVFNAGVDKKNYYYLGNSQTEDVETVSDLNTFKCETQIGTNTY